MIIGDSFRFHTAWGRKIKKKIQRLFRHFPAWSNEHRMLVFLWRFHYTNFDRACITSLQKKSQKLLNCQQPVKYGPWNNISNSIQKRIISYPNALLFHICHNYNHIVSGSNHNYNSYLFFFLLCLNWRRRPLFITTCSIRNTSFPRQKTF